MSQEGLNCHPSSQGERATSSEKRGQDFPSANKAQTDAGRESGWRSREQNGVADPQDLSASTALGAPPCSVPRGHLTVSTWLETTGARTGILTRSFLELRYSQQLAWLQEPKLRVPGGATDCLG